MPCADGEEAGLVKQVYVKGYKKNEKEAFSQDLKNLKNSTAEWQAKIEESIR